MASLSIYAWKDWFKSLCGLILLMAFIEHESMPKHIMGIQGLNPWNLLFIAIVLAWAANRRREGLTWDMPRYISILLLMYLAVIVVGIVRLILDRGYLPAWYPVNKIISEDLINNIKWILPGILLFDGCRNRRRVIMAAACLLALYFLLAVEVVILMPSGARLSQLLLEQNRLYLSGIGYNPVDLSGMLAGAFWGSLTVLPFIRNRKYRILLLVVSGIFIYSQALTGGRAGYIAWIGTGLGLCVVKWRKYILLAPVVLLAVSVTFESSVDRLFRGFGITDITGQSVIDDTMVTSGRTLMWPYIIDKIGESPLVGYGRKAMYRTGISNRVLDELGETSFGHPHNMYLETLLDNGILGSLPIFLFWGTMIIYSIKLFRNKNRLCSAIGGLSLSLILAQLFTGIGSQHFYPLESTFGVWTTMFLALRVTVATKQSRISLQEEDLETVHLAQESFDYGISKDYITC
ncbi:MAG: O-antigen ligase family protein [Sedimentisphaerales bacterium]|nr:O-antigen ligase family protein [Sedimentisphaerales bacterium]